MVYGNASYWRWKRHTFKLYMYRTGLRQLRAVTYISFSQNPLYMQHIIHATNDQKTSTTVGGVDHTVVEIVDGGIRCTSPESKSRVSCILHHIRK